MAEENEGKRVKRGRPRRSWVKIDCAGMLRGSINWQLSLEEQAIWVKLIAYSAVCGGEPGWIQDNDQRPLPHEFIAQELHCPAELLEATLAKCVDEGRCLENGAGIQITHFDDYQFTEYDRQRPYRDKKKAEEKNPDRFIEGKYGHIVKR